MLPDVINGSFLLADIEYSPYVYNARGEVQINYKANRRYTMKDIGKLETRIETLEEVTSLSLLETKTSALTIKDPTTGLDRFKNGFVVDPFNNYDIADKTQTEIKFEVEGGKLTARKHRDAIDLLMGSNTVVGLTGAPDPTVDPRFATDLNSPNVKKTGNVVTLDYSEVEEKNHTIAPRRVGVNPY